VLIASSIPHPHPATPNALAPSLTSPTTNVPSKYPSVASASMGKHGNLALGHDGAARNHFFWAPAQ
jgi:hypothetical protein